MRDSGIKKIGKYRPADPSIKRIVFINPNPVDESEREETKRKGIFSKRFRK
jgi:hypothetical protein